MATVRELLKAKGDKIWSISPKATAYEALQLMAEKDVGALLVLDEGNLVGVFSERDYARKVILKGKFSKETAVCELMTSAVLYIVVPEKSGLGGG
jgi:CBS domain-containing protein